jgi:hypothetical protein
MRAAVRAVAASALAAGGLGWALFSSGGTAGADPVVPALPCTSASQAPAAFSIGSGPGQYGYYAAPAAPPKGIVAVEHGYQQTALSVAPYLQQIATDDGVIAFAMDNTGTVDAGPGSTSSRGWRVEEGAADTALVAKAVDGACDAGTTFENVLFGVSMGGDTSGIAAAAGSTRQDGKTALFDYWFDVSGVSNLTETYLEAAIDSPLSSYAAEAVADIQTETGGNPASVPQRYLGDSPVTLAQAMRASGIKGAVVLHAVMDGLVTSDEGDQALTALVAAQVPTDFYTAVLQTPGQTSTTLDGDLLGQADKSYVSPFAGHVGGIVVATALQRLEALFSGVAPTGLSVTLSDGQLGTVPIASLPGA